MKTFLVSALLSTPWFFFAYAAMAEGSGIMFSGIVAMFGVAQLVLPSVLPDAEIYEPKAPE